MPERPGPDLDHTREALRRHDEREREDEERKSEDVKPGEGDEEEPEPPSEEWTPRFRVSFRGRSRIETDVVRAGVVFRQPRVPESVETDVMCVIRRS